MKEENKRDNLLNKKISRLDMLKMIGTGAVTMTGLPYTNLLAEAMKPSGKRPNIIYILGDNHNADTMGVAGHPFIKTPGMDRLAREGVMFNRTYNTTSLCSPSRASILTGAFAHNHGVKNNHTPWTGQMKVFLEYLSQNGYATAFVGKWHMPGKGLPKMPFLDLFVSYTYREGQGSYFDCPMIVNGKEVPSRKPYITDEVTDYAIEFMEAEVNKPEQKPFCIYLSHRPGHPPFQSPEDIKGMYDDEDLTGLVDKQADPAWFGKTNGFAYQGMMMGTYHGQYRKYCEVLTAMDREIVRLLDRVDELGLTENTIVVYMGDNGHQWGSHGRHAIKDPYEDSARLPFIVKAPGLIRDAGQRREQIVANIDIAPTILDMAGAPIPQTMDGKSLVPLLKYPQKKVRDACLLEFWRYFPENTPSYVGVITHRWKYIEYERGRENELFDLKNDPKELKNLIDTPEGKQLIPALKKKIKELQAV